MSVNLSEVVVNACYIQILNYMGVRCPVVSCGVLLTASRRDTGQCKNGSCILTPALFEGELYFLLYCFKPPLSPAAAKELQEGEGEALLKHHLCVSDSGKEMENFFPLCKKEKNFPFLKITKCLKQREADQLLGFDASDCMCWNGTKMEQFYPHEKRTQNKNKNKQ